MAHLRKLLQANKEEEAIAVARAILDNAKQGNGSAMTQILNRIDGPIEPPAVSVSLNLTTLTDAELRALEVVRRAMDAAR